MQFARGSSLRQKYKKIVANITSKKNLPLLLIVLSLIILPVIILFTQKQQSLTQYASTLDTIRIESESGTTSGPVQIITDANASGGKAIRLNASNETTTSPTNNATTQPAGGTLLGQ